MCSLLAHSYLTLDLHWIPMVPVSAVGATNFQTADPQALHLDDVPLKYAEVYTTECVI